MLKREVVLPSEAVDLAVRTKPWWRRPLQALSDWLFGPPGPYDWIL